MYDIKIKCQRMVGQYPACPIGRAVTSPRRYSSLTLDEVLRNIVWYKLHKTFAYYQTSKTQQMISAISCKHATKLQHANQEEVSL